MSLTKAPNHIYICTFNVYQVGSVADTYTSLEQDNGDDEPPTFGIPARIKNLANVLAVGDFDLVVLEEVTHGLRGHAALGDLVHELRTEHGLEYRYFLSDFIGNGLMAEAIAFLYDPTAVQPEILPGTTSLAQNIAIPGRDLVRTQWEAGDFDFTLIAAHLAWGNEADRDAGYAEVHEIFLTATPSQYSDDPDIIVLGDFNRFGAGFDSVLELDFDPNRFLAPNVTFFDPAFSTKKQVTKALIAGKGVPGDNPQLLSTTVAGNRYVYDMILMSRDAAEEFPPGAGEAGYGLDFGIVHFDESDGFGFQDGADTLSHNELKEAYSDHRPLWMRFRVDTGQADDGPGGLDVPSIVVGARYVATATGGRFHRPNCRTIRNRETTREWATRQAAAAELPPCGVCRP